MGDKPMLKVIKLDHIRDIRDILASRDFDFCAGSSSDLYDFGKKQLNGVDLWVRNTEKLLKVVRSFSPKVTESTAHPVDGFTHFAFAGKEDYEILLVFLGEQFPEFEVADAGSSSMYL